MKNISDQYDSSMQFFYRLNDYTVSNDRRISYSNETNELYRKYLNKNDLVFKNYLKNAVYPKYMPSLKEFIFDPWLESLWDNWHKFKEKLFNFSDGNLDSDGIEFKKIILNHIDDFYSNKNTADRSFELTQDELKFYQGFRKNNPLQ